MPIVAKAETQERTLNCQLQVHQHSSECYNEENQLICGLADYVVHTHNSGCYHLICQQEEGEGHTHTVDCYQQEQKLACTITENQPHTHTEECYITEKELVCTEPVLHTHTESCYDESGALFGTDGTIKTNASGEYSFKHLAHGDYIVAFSGDKLKEVQRPNRSSKGRRQQYPYQRRRCLCRPKRYKG